MKACGGLQAAGTEMDAPVTAGWGCRWGTDLDGLRLHRAWSRWREESGDERHTQVYGPLHLFTKLDVFNIDFFN